MWFCWKPAGTERSFVVRERLRRPVEAMCAVLAERQRWTFQIAGRLLSPSAWLPLHARRWFIRVSLRHERRLSFASRGRRQWSWLRWPRSTWSRRRRIICLDEGTKYSSLQWVSLRCYHWQYTYTSDLRHFGPKTFRFFVLCAPQCHSVIATSGRLKLGFGLAAECGQLCIFGQYSASAECEIYSSAKPLATAIFCHRIRLWLKMIQRWYTFMRAVARIKHAFFPCLPCCLQDNSPTNRLAVSQVADWITRGLVNSPTANF